MQSAFNFKYFLILYFIVIVSADSGIWKTQVWIWHLPLTSNYTLNIWITSSFTEITIKRLRIQVFGNRDCTKMGRLIAVISQLSWCSNKIMCIKELLKLLLPMNHYPSSFMVFTLSVMIIYCVWSSVVAGATCINTKEPTACNSSQPCVQCLYISHLTLAKVGIFT